MGQTIPLSQTMNVGVSDRAVAKTVSIPWYIWANLIAVISGVVGGVWDISWHESVGRDTFWTTPHMFIQGCGILAGLSCAYLIFSITFNKNNPMRESSVTMWGFRGPLGAFICAWGAAAMITSAPFDNWWHNAYGLDVKILSPPHVLLALGMMGIRFGVVVLILAEMNRAEGAHREKLERVFIFAFVFLIATTVGMAQEYTNRVLMHTARFYLTIALTAPIWFAAISRASKSRWAATIMTAAYTTVHLIFIYVLPLAPATPKLGPVYQNITHLVPPDFPLLLIVAAFVFDLVRQRIGQLGRWTQSAVLGAVFLGSFIAVQWPFANFLMSPAAQNRVFVANNYPYFMPSTSLWVRNIFAQTEHSPLRFWIVMFEALLVSVVMMYIGFSWGDWMRRIRR
jgi:hypothetical protein